MLFGGVNIFSATNYDYLKWGANFGPLTLTGNWWRVITCCFIHKGLVHLVNNMILIISMGFILEMVYGKRRFAYTYLLSGLFAAYFSLLFHSETPSVGASGAMFGIVGLLISGSFINKALIDFRKGFLGAVLGLIAINLLYGISNKMIDLAAHCGGFLAGFVLGWVYGLLDILISKKRIVLVQNIVELLFVLLFIFLFGNMASSVPTDYILLRKGWDSGAVEKMMERKKAEKKKTSMYEPSVDFYDSWKCSHHRGLGGKGYVLKGKGSEILYTDYYIEGKRSYMDIINKKAPRFSYITEFK